MGSDLSLKQWYHEEWQFQFEVKDVKGGLDNCRLGLEPGDRFQCGYGCPEGFCPKTILITYHLLEAVRSGGDLRNLGGPEADTYCFTCPDGVVKFRLTAKRL